MIMGMGDYVYVWADGHVELLNDIYMVKYLGERPKYVCMVYGDDKFSDASRLIKARKALSEEGEVIRFLRSEDPLEAIYEALIKSPVDNLVQCTIDLKKVLA